MSKKLLSLSVMFALLFAVSCDQKGGEEHTEDQAATSETEESQKSGSPDENVISMMDTNGDSKVSEDEFMAHFDVKDTNSDGVISKEEMREHHIKVHGNDKMFEDRFSMTDKDGNAEVSKEECNNKFKKMDDNGDGFLTAEEFKGRMKKSKKM